MTIAEISKIENDRSKPEQFGVIHLFSESNFYRAHDWSAWLMTTFPFGESVNTPLKISAKKLKNDSLTAWVGFPISSLNKYIPDDGSVGFTPINYEMIDVTIGMPDEYANMEVEDIQKMVDEWLGGLPLTESKPTKRGNKEVAEVAPRMTKMRYIMGAVLSYPIESKSPMEVWEYLRQLRQQVAAKFEDFTNEIVAHSTYRGKSTGAAYQTLIKQVNNFQKNVTLQDIDLDFLNRFSEWSKKQGMSQSTISGRLKSLRAIINEAIARKLMSVDDDPFRKFKIKKIANRKEFLRWDEVKKLESLPLKKRESRVRDAALFALYTGLRFSDLNTLTQDHLITDDGKVWLVKTPEKTKGTSGAVVNLPLYSLFDGKPLRLLEKYNMKIEKLAHVGNNAAANRTLKEIMKKIGISEERQITFHTLRHSFASLLISKGVPITTVQKLCGHAKIDMTLNYAHMTTYVVRDDVEKAFSHSKEEENEKK